MENKETYSMQEIAALLNKPRTTVTDWSTTFKSYLPVVGSGRTKRYKKEALQIFQLIKDLKDANQPTETIEEYLTQVSPEIVIYEDQQEPSDNVPVLSTLIHGYENLIGELQQQNEFLAKMYTEAKEQNEKILKEMAAMNQRNEKYECDFNEIKQSLKDNTEIKESVGLLLAIEEDKKVAAAQQKKSEDGKETTKSVETSWLKRLFKKD